MLSYPDRSVFRAKLAEKGDPQMMDEKHKTASADFLRRANEDYGLHRVAIGDPIGNGAEAINLTRFAKECMPTYLAVIDPDETIPRDTHRVRSRNFWTTWNRCRVGRTTLDRGPSTFDQSGRHSIFGNVGTMVHRASDGTDNRTRE